MSIQLRISDLRKEKKLSQKDFASSIGMDDSQYSKLERGKLQPTIHQVMDICSKYETSTDWLLFGTEASDQEDDQHRKIVKHIPLENSVNEPQNHYKSQWIPLIPLDAMAGYGSGTMQVMDYDTERYIVPEFTELKTDFMIRVKGSSMYPTYNSGDIVACKKLPEQTFYQWNKVYVLDTVQGPMIKRIHASDKEGHIMCVSDNEKYKPFDIHLDDIFSLSLVVGVIRLE